jgi:hypothetical protein
MPGPITAYVVAFSAMLLAGISALTLIYAVNHFDRWDVRSSPDDVLEKVAV